MVKTELADKVKAEDVPKSSNRWKIASYISFVVIVGLIGLNIFSRSDNIKDRDKSIAVLPLEYLSENPEKAYLADGVLDAITGHLSMLEGLRVMPRTSVEKYRDSEKTAKEIGEELGVTYLIEGSFLMVGDMVTLTIQLVDAEKQGHIFYNSYDRNYSDILAVQSEVAQTIAREIGVAITPQEKSLIEKIPTDNLTAYDYYMKAEDYLWEYEKGMGDTTLLSQAERLYLMSAQQDPKFAKAYTGLAKVYWEKNSPYMPFPNQDLIKKGKEYLDKAFYRDDQLDEVYILRGKFMSVYGDTVNAIIQLNKALDLNPNSWEAYYSLGHLYFLKDQKKTLENLLKASQLYHGPLSEKLMSDIGQQFAFAGFYDQSKQYWGKALELNNDTLEYLYRLAVNECWRENYQESIALCKKILDIDSTFFYAIDRIAYNYLLLKEPNRAYPLYKKIENYIVENDQGNLHRIAYVYSEVGEKEKANEFFDQVEQIKLQIIEITKTTDYFTNYDLAGIYAYKGEKQKAYEYLKVFRQNPRPYEWNVTLLKNDPLFDSLRDEIEFQQIVRDVEVKYQAEHDRIRQWLEENDML